MVFNGSMILIDSVSRVRVKLQCPLKVNAFFISQFSSKSKYFSLNMLKFRFSFWVCKLHDREKRSG